MDGLTSTFREKIVTFGERDSLVGVVSLPASPRPGAPFVVLINSGIVHRVGAHRSYVTFARAFAAAGLPTLRFDLSGIGDSERPASGLPLQDTVQRDIAAALDYLCAKQGSETFVLAGLCSGAFDAFVYALSDPRVVGACMLDMPGPFRNWTYLAYWAADRALTPASWANLAKRLSNLVRVPVVKKAVDPEGRGGVFLPGVRAHLPRERMEADLDTLLKRGVDLIFLFTGGVGKDYNHRLQFRLRFPRAASHPRLKTEYIPWSDHTFSTKVARDYVSAYLRDWIVQQTTARTRAPAPAPARSAPAVAIRRS